MLCKYHKDDQLDGSVLESLKSSTLTLGNGQMIPKRGDAQTLLHGRSSKLWSEQITQNIGGCSVQLTNVERQQ